MQHPFLRGLDLHAPSNELVENNTGSTILRLKVVALAGMGTVYPQVIVGNPTVNPSFGIAGVDIGTTTGQNFGLVTCLGFMFNVNTAAWTVGTLLYSTTSGDLSAVSLGTPVARVISQDATFGIIYVFAVAGLVSEGDISWLTTGNAAQPGDFLGTNTAEDLRFRTAGTQKMVLDQAGRLGIGEATPSHNLEFKTHSNANASGVGSDTWYVETTATGFNTALVIPVSDPSIVRLEFTANCKKGDGTDRASFRRSGVFYRQSSNVQVQGASWQSDFTYKSNNLINVQYILGVNSITIQVQPTDSSLHRWAGMVTVQQVL